MTNITAEEFVESFQVPQEVTYNWEYEATRKQLMRLYENAERGQWNSSIRLDWSHLRRGSTASTITGR